jgi:7-cyano-7-deazaguanine synthase
MDAKACVLVSGGVESAALVSDALGRYSKITPLYVRSHLRWEEAEIFWLKQFLRSLRSHKVEPLVILDGDNRPLYGRHWSVTGTNVPGAKSRDESVYLPGRNILLLSKAGCFAAVNGHSAVEIGILKGNPFSDATPAFLKKIADVLSIGLGMPIEVNAPLAKFKKDQLLAMSQKLPLELTFSCIDPKGFDHCGECNKCIERKKAFFSAGIFDRTKYRKKGIS